MLTQRTLSRYPYRHRNRPIVGLMYQTESVPQRVPISCRMALNDMVLNDTVMRVTDVTMLNRWGGGDHGRL